MRLCQKAIAGGLVVAGLAGLLSYDKYPDTPKVNYQGKEAIAQVQS